MTSSRNLLIRSVLAGSPGCVDRGGRVATEPDRDRLLSFLSAQRNAVLAVVDGLDPVALRRSVVPSGWTPLGLVDHLADAEHHWLSYVMSDRSDHPSGTGCAPDAPAATVVARYRRVCAIGDEVIAALPLDAAPFRPDTDADPPTDISDLRGVILHLIEETARHAGHLDLARELLDGRTGLGPR